MIARRRDTSFPLPLWIAAIGWVAVLFYFSGQNGAESGALSLRVANFILRACPFIDMPLELFHPMLRKLAHFGIFAVEGFLLGLALMRSLNRGALGGALGVAICAAMAALNEYHQSFMAGRTSQASDALIDSAGALAGALFAWLIFCALRRRARRR